MPAMQILPPDLSTNESASSSDKKPFQSLEFLPNKLASGQSVEVRLLGTYETDHIAYLWRCPVEERQPDGTLRFAGYDFSTSYEGFPNAARATDWSSPTREKLDEKVKPKRCLACLVYNYANDRVEVALFEQKAIRDGIVEVLTDEDYSFDSEGIANFTLKVGRQGEKLDTSYSILPKSGKKVEAKVAAAFEAVKDTAKMSDLVNGRHPLRKPAEFSSAASNDAEF